MIAPMRRLAEARQWRPRQSFVQVVQFSKWRRSYGFDLTYIKGIDGQDASSDGDGNSKEEEEEEVSLIGVIPFQFRLSTTVKCRWNLLTFVIFTKLYDTRGTLGSRAGAPARIVILVLSILMSMVIFLSFSSLT